MQSKSGNHLAVNCLETHGVREEEDNLVLWVVGRWGRHIDRDAVQSTSEVSRYHEQPDCADVYFSILPVLSQRERKMKQQRLTLGRALVANTCTTGSTVRCG
jgi:hypothetical protein